MGAILEVGNHVIQTAQLEIRKSIIKGNKNAVCCRVIWHRSKYPGRKLVFGGKHVRLEFAYMISSAIFALSGSRQISHVSNLCLNFLICTTVEP